MVLRAAIPELLVSITAATVFDTHRRPVLALALSSPTSAREPVYRFYGERLRVVAETVTRAIGGNPPAEYRTGVREELAIDSG